MRDQWHRALRVAAVGLSFAACSDTSSPSTAAGATSDAAASTTRTTESTGTPLAGKVQLVDVAMFEQTAAQDDPYADRPQDASVCEFGFGLENGLFEIQTDLCAYAGFEQPTLAPIRTGDTLEFLLIHDALYAEEPGVSAHLSIALGDAVVWETSIPFPAEPGIVRPEWTADADAPEGTPLRLHIHNHGVNNYRFAAMTVEYSP